MGLVGRILGLGTSAEQIGGAIEQVAEVFVSNKTKADAHEYQRQSASLDQYSREFKNKSNNKFDSFINGLNRLPRPILALGTVGLFSFAMVDPVRFTDRMIGLERVPDPLWWLLGAIVSFYFGARELHYIRQEKQPIAPLASLAQMPAPTDRNAALDEWKALHD